VNLSYLYAKIQFEILSPEPTAALQQNKGPSKDTSQIYTSQPNKAKIMVITSSYTITKPSVLQDLLYLAERLKM